MREKLLCFVMVAMLLVGSVAAEVMVSVDGTQKYIPNAYEPNPWMEGNVTKAEHLSAWGNDVLKYEDDYGAVQTLPFGEVTSVSFYPTDIVNTSWQNVTLKYKDTVLVSNWTTTWNRVSANPGSSYGQEYVETAEGFPGVKFYFVGNSTRTAYEGRSITFSEAVTDPLVRLTLVGKIDYATSASAIELMLYDSAGNWVKYRYDNVKTGEIFFIQLPFSEIATGEDHGPLKLYSKSGTLSDLYTVRFNFVDTSETSEESINMTLWGLYLQRSEFSFGLDENGDKVTDAFSGPVTVKTFDPNFKYDKIKNMQIGFKYRASDLPAEDTYVTEEDFTQSGYYKKINYYFNWSLPNDLSLSWSDLVLKDSLNVPGIQFTYANLKEGSVDRTITSLYTGEKIGHPFVLDDTISPGTVYALELNLALTKEQYEGISEQVGAIFGSNPDAIWNRIWLWIASFLGIGWGVKRIRKRGK